ncbi:MAG: NADH-quinone oxidoreductase subunit A [Thermoanaerobaculia bacterium]|nr:NADH-quinone oxidoreductase subunit A [Thermoanaerobaculia bacterium]
MTYSFVPILIMLGFAVILGGTMLGLNWLIGRHQRSSAKLTPYESGVPQLDLSRKRMNVKFYKVAMSFIIFDIEAAFIYPWAVIYRDTTRSADGLVWLPFWAMIIFTIPIALGFLYEWRKGTFDWT